MLGTVGESLVRRSGKSEREKGGVVVEAVADFVEKLGGGFDILAS